MNCLLQQDQVPESAAGLTTPEPAPINNSDGLDAGSSEVIKPLQLDGLDVSSGEDQLPAQTCTGM